MFKIIISILLVISLFGCSIEDSNQTTENHSANYYLYGAKVAIFLSKYGYSYSEFSNIYDGLKSQSQAEIVITSNNFYPIELESRYDEDNIPYVNLLDLDINEIDSIIIIGGRGVRFDVEEKDNELIEFMRSFAQTGKIMGGICSGSGILAISDLIDGRKVTGIDYMQETIEEYGGVFTTNNVEIDGQFITAMIYSEELFLEYYISRLHEQITSN